MALLALELTLVPELVLDVALTAYESFLRSEFGEGRGGKLRSKSANLSAMDEGIAPVSGGGTGLETWVFGFTTV